MSYLNQHRTPAPMEKLVAVLSYIFPLVGFAFIIIATLMKKDIKPFLKYHIFQAIFIAFSIWIIFSGLGFLMHLLSYIPFLNTIVSMFTFFLNTPIFLGFSVISFIYFVFILYLIIGVLRGTGSYVPWVSDIIKANLRGQI